MVANSVVLSLLSADQEYQVLQASEAEIVAKRRGIELETIFAKNNAILQREHLYRHIGGFHKPRPAAVLLHPLAGDGWPKVAVDATKAGVGWILLNRDFQYIDELRVAHPTLPIGVVTIDQLAIGRIQGQQLLRLLPTGGSVLYLQGPPDNTAAQQRLQAMKQVIETTAVELIVLNADWTETGAEKAIATWLRLSRSRDVSIRAVVAQNDAMAMGARKAIAETMPQWLGCPFLGCDGTSSGGQRFVRERSLTATIIIKPTAGVAVDIVANQITSGARVPARTALEPTPYPAQ